MVARIPDRVCGYLEGIERLAPLIAEQREAFDRDRRLPDAVFCVLADAGLFRLWLPAALDGPELSPSDFMTVVEAASALDGSIGWLVGNGGGMSRIGGYLKEPIARDVFSDPRAFVTSATGSFGVAQRAEGGYRLTGRWSFGSGARHASHFMGLATVKSVDGADEPALCCYFERRDVVIHDTWHVSGLRATGSSDFEVRDLFVPEQRTHVFIGCRPTQDGMIYRLPSLSAFAWTVSVVPLGIARGAMNVFVEIANRKARTGASTLLRDREILQSAFGRADTVHRAARALLVNAMNELMAASEEDGRRLMEARAVFRSACTHAGESAARIVDSLAAELGTAAIFETSPIERFIRDVHAAVKHIAMSPNNYVVTGRMGLGLDPGTPRF